MNYPVSSIRLRAALTTLAASLSLLLMGGGTRASICWSGEQNINFGLEWGMDFVHLDANGDGTDDFRFMNWQSTLSVLPTRGNAGAANPADPTPKYLPLPSGASIGQVLPPPYLWATEDGRVALPMDHYANPDNPPGSPWYSIRAGILGISFKIGEHTHYGWIRMSAVSYVAFMLHDWAYETQPGVPINAGAKPRLMAAPHVVRPHHLRLKWRRQVGKTYRVQVTTRLDPPTWTDAQLFGCWLTPTHTAVDVIMLGRAQFFRLVEKTVAFYPFR